MLVQGFNLWVIKQLQVAEDLAGVGVISYCQIFLNGPTPSLTSGSTLIWQDGTCLGHPDCRVSDQQAPVS
ncbi:hypothetical protein J6590_013442 [Homalodisca vitripennis]|nr:hypothetical protein J6590_013442 [Homalodisca vitripennis]